ncbi:MAG TPA: hypothetical protein VL485_07285 [Ktedonobacteraceae bacterium]|nr:hypothetical protein [Ktedonobacteraceae bacterium]
MVYGDFSGLDVGLVVAVADTDWWGIWQVAFVAEWCGEDIYTVGYAVGSCGAVFYARC